MHDALEFSEPPSLPRLPPLRLRRQTYSVLARRKNSRSAQVVVTDHARDHSSRCCLLQQSLRNSVAVSRRKHVSGFANSRKLSGGPNPVPVVRTVHVVPETVPQPSTSLKLTGTTSRSTASHRFVLHRNNSSTPTASTTITQLENSIPHIYYSASDPHQRDLINHGGSARSSVPLSRTFPTRDVSNNRTSSVMDDDSREKKRRRQEDTQGGPTVPGKPYFTDSLDTSRHQQRRRRRNDGGSPNTSAHADTSRSKVVSSKRSSGTSTRRRQNSSISAERHQTSTTPKNYYQDHRQYPDSTGSDAQRPLVVPHTAAPSRVGDQKTVSASGSGDSPKSSPRRGTTRAPTSDGGSTKHISRHGIGAPESKDHYHHHDAAAVKLEQHRGELKDHQRYNSRADADNLDLPTHRHLGADTQASSSSQKVKLSAKRVESSASSSVNSSSTSVVVENSTIPPFAAEKPSTHKYLLNGGDHQKIRDFPPLCPIPPTPVEGPPAPLHPPTTIAQLRLLLLVGFISSQTLPALSHNKPAFAVPPHSAAAATRPRAQTARLSFPCPIHSAMVAKMLRDFFIIHCSVPSSVVSGLQTDLIATELRLLERGLYDVLLGPVEPLFSLDVISSDAVIVETFDFVRCDRVVRSSLRPEHPSLATSLWDISRPPLRRAQCRELQLGAGIGVESRASQLLACNNFGVLEPDVGLPKKTGEAEVLGMDETVLSSLTAEDKLQHVSSSFGTYDEFGVNNVFSPLDLFRNTESLLRSHDGHSTTGVLQNGILGTQRPTPSVPPVAGVNTPFFQQPPPLPVARPSVSSTPSSSLPERLTTGTLLDGTGGVGGILPYEGKDVMSIEALLNAPSAKEQQLRESGAELRQLLTVPTAKHSMTTRAFQNRGGSRVQQICRHGTRHDCLEAAIALYNQRKSPGDPVPKVCGMVHFRRILLPHTDVSLGDCSYLDTCRHMASCRFVHYEVDLDVGSDEQKFELLERMEATEQTGGLGHNIGTVFSGHLQELPAQWITCDVRKFDWSIFRGKVKVLMADPPWDIHMDLPYGTMTDAEMKSLRLDQVQDEGCLFLWVTGRAMELGRECMKLWGYRQIEEIVWVKTNQLHRIIRTGRTGHWLNHSKEHCLVGIKGNPKLNRNIDTDIIVAEVRETSRKPDEIYRIIERLCPGPYKLELFGRAHNVRDNWITLGNQLDNVHLDDPQLIQRYNAFANTTAGMIKFTPPDRVIEDDERITAKKLISQSNLHSYE